MHSTWHDLRSAGFSLLLLLPLLALSGLVLFTFLIRAARRRSKIARRLAIAASVIGVALAALGGLGVIHGQRVTDATIPELETPLHRELARRDGYENARSAARLGLLLAFFPLLAGATTLFAGARRRGRVAASWQDPDAPPPPPDGIGLPIGVTMLGALAVSFSIAELRVPLPGRDIPVDHPAWALLDEVDSIRRADDRNELRRGCDKLEQRLFEKPSAAHPATAPELSVVVRKCVEQRSQQAALLPTLSAVARELDEVASSRLAQRDPEARRHVEADLEQVRRMAASWSGPPVEPDGLEF